MVTISCRASAARPGRPITSAWYLARADTPGWNRSSCAREITRPLRRTAASLARSDPLVLFVPCQRPPDPLAERDRRRETEFPARPVDPEGAALGEEVDAPPVQRRLDPERAADCLARRPGQPERPHRQMQARARHPGGVRDEPDELVQRGYFPAG